MRGAFWAYYVAAETSAITGVVAQTQPSQTQTITGLFAHRGKVQQRQEIGRQSATVTVTLVGKVPTEMALSYFSPFVLVGESTSFFFVVTGDGVGIPTGTVTVKDGDTTLGTATVDSGTATFTTSSLTVGTHSIFGIYGGDNYYFGSLSDSGTVEVAHSFELQPAQLKMRVNGLFIPVTLYERVGTTWEAVVFTARQPTVVTGFDDLGLHKLIHQDLLGQYIW